MSMSGKRMPTMMHKAVRVLAVLLAVALIWPQPFAMAQAAQGGSPTRSCVLSTGGGQALIDPSDTVMLLLDHQSGLFQTVKDISVAELRANTVALAKLATLLNIPVITSASEPNGPNGPLMPEIHQFAPHAVFVLREGEVNAWDNEDFVKAVRATGKKRFSHLDSLVTNYRRRDSGRCGGSAPAQVSPPHQWPVVTVDGDHTSRERCDDRHSGRSPSGGSEAQRASTRPEDNCASQERALNGWSSITPKGLSADRRCTMRS